MVEDKTTMMVTEVPATEVEVLNNSDSGGKSLEAKTLEFDGNPQDFQGFCCKFIKYIQEKEDKM